MSLPRRKNRSEVDLVDYKTLPLIGPKVAVGVRNDFLVGKGNGHALRLAALYKGDFDELLKRLRWINKHHFEEPLGDADIVRKANWAHNIQMTGKNGFGRSGEPNNKKLQIPSNLNDILPRSATGRMASAVILELIAVHSAHHVFCLRPLFINKVLGRKYLEGKKAHKDIKKF